MGKRPILNICIPTYNRKDVLISDVKCYLSCPDSRFRIVIQDNASTDNTREDIDKLNNPRIIYRRNSENIGGPLNGVKALSNNDSEYSMIVIDKDFVQIEELPGFLDFLESDAPNFGYVNLQIETENPTIFYKKGYKAAKNLGFLSKHPSGFFFKSDLWDDIVNSDWFKSIPSSFDFTFDLVAGALSIHYDGAVYGKPLIRNANYRIFPTKVKTITYNQNNFYFSPKIVIQTMKKYLNCVFANNPEYKLKKRICRIILLREANRVTFGYRDLLSNKKVCDYYSLQMRHLSFFDMYQDLNRCINDFVKFSKSKLRNSDIIKYSTEVKARYLLSFMKRQIKRLIKKY